MLWATDEYVLRFWKHIQKNQTEQTELINQL